MTVQCGWCDGPIPRDARSDSKYCSTRCRQASHRFTSSTRRRLRNDPTLPLRFGYGDPPYVGLSKRYYGAHPDFDGEVDQRALLARLGCSGEFDGWALSASSASLGQLLAHVADLGISGVRVAAWVKGSVPHSAPRGPVSSWEPVLYCGAREGTLRPDSLVHASRPRLTDPRRVIGAKPAEFCRWLFELLGAQPGDSMVDLFPGSAGVTRAWSIYASTTVKSDASRQYCGDVSAKKGGEVG